jgi:hypothetical protein
MASRRVRGRRVPTSLANSAAPPMITRNLLRMAFLRLIRQQ